MRAPLTGVRVVHLVPASGGVATYARALRDVYADLGALVTPLVSKSYAGRRRDGQQLLTEVGDKLDLLHVELGEGHSTAFWAAVEAQRRGLPLLVTVHDRAVVRNAFPLPDPTSQRLGLAGAVIQRVSTIVSGPLLVPRLARPLASHRASLMAADPHARFHLPHPRMVDAALAREPGTRNNDVRRLGLIGYWSPSKGIPKLMAAWERARPPGSTLVVTGASGDRYGRRIAPRLRRLPSTEVIDVLADDAAVDAALLGLDVLLLPYTAAWSGTASGVAQRAAELGVPILASDIPALRSQLGDGGALWVEPGSAPALADAIQRACREPQSVALAAVSARHHVLLTLTSLPELLTLAVTHARSNVGAGRICGAGPAS